MTSREKRLDIAMLLGTAAAVAFAAFAGFSEKCDRLYDSTFRVHILADSDQEKDQRIKYELRDHLISEFGEIFASCGSKAEAVKLAERNLMYISRCSEEFLRGAGYDQSVSCSVENTAFPTRVYGDVTLPAGNYDALEIVIGSGEGSNWWCVLYPSVCLDAVSTEKHRVFPERELYLRHRKSNKATADSLKAQRGEIEYRFALYDILRSLFGI